MVVLISACSGQAGEFSSQAEIARQASQEAGEGSALAAGVSLGSESSVNEPPLPVIRLGSAEFHASDPASVKLDSGRLQLVEFFAYWCAVCKAMAPTMHGLESLYGDQINFIYLDRDDPDTYPLQERLGYVYQPHFFLLDERGAILAQWRGFVDGVELQRALTDALEQ